MILLNNNGKLRQCLYIFYIEFGKEKDKIPIVFFFFSFCSFRFPIDRFIMGKKMFRFVLQFYFVTDRSMYLRKLEIIHEKRDLCCWKNHRNPTWVREQR